MQVKQKNRLTNESPTIIMKYTWRDEINMEHFNQQDHSILSMKFASLKKYTITQTAHHLVHLSVDRRNFGLESLVLQPLMDAMTISIVWVISLVQGVVR